MAIFPHLDFERKVQVNDKTRLDVQKSFVSKGSAAITALTVTPGSENTAQSVFDATVSNRYLDWEFATFKCDVDTTNNKIDFYENGVLFTATLLSGAYDVNQLATEIKTRLEVVGSETYTVSFDTYTNKYTISSTGNFRFVYGSNASVSFLPYLFIKESQTSVLTTFTTPVIEYFPKKIVVIVTAGSSVTENFYLKLYSSYGDRLFSSDGDLVAHEADILRYVPQGRTSFNDVHRKSQEMILAWLDEQGYVDSDGNRLTKFSLVDLDEVRQWSAFQALELICFNQSNAVDDIWDRKSREYAKRKVQDQNRAILRFDKNNDGAIDTGEAFAIGSSNLVRR